MSGRGANGTPPTNAGRGQPSPQKVKVQGPRRGQQNQNQQNKFPARVKFEGRCDELKGHVFDIRAGQADLFVRTKKEIMLYVGRTYKNSFDTVSAIDELVLPILVEPPEPASSTVTKAQTRIWEKKLDQHAIREYNLETNIQSLYSLAWGQCSDAMQSKVEAMPAFAISAQPLNNGVELLILIKKVAFNYQSSKYLAHAIHEAKRNFYRLHQGKFMTCQMYLESFVNHVDILTYVGAPIIADEGLVKQVAAGAATITDAHSTKAKDRYLAVAFVLGADRGRYRKLIEDFENSHLVDINIYPNNVNDAYNLLVNWKHDAKSAVAINTSDGVMFNNVGEETEDDTDGTDLMNKGSVKKAPPNVKHITCFNCYEKGHYSTDCPHPKKDEEGANMLISAIEEGEFEEGDFDGYVDGCVFAQNYTEQTSKHGKIPKDWILLDSQSTVDVFSNPELLSNIRATKGKLTIHCNAGTASTNLIGDFDRYGTVWYHPKGIANILSLAKVKQKYRVTYDSEQGNMFQVHKLNGSTCDFKQSTPGLYYMDMEEQKQQHGTTLVNTVADNKSNYSNLDYSRACLARKLQVIIGRPTSREFVRIVRQGLLPNCPVTPDDIKAADDIFGPDIGSLKGKTVRHSQDRVHPNISTVPLDILDRYRSITICGDIMFVNKIAFLITISRHVRFGTVEMLPNRNATTIATAIQNVNRVYRTRGFKIETLLMDGEFQAISGNVAELGIILNTAANNEHVSDIERYIRTVKERCRCIYNTLPFTRMPARLIIEMVHYSVFWLNSFAHRSGISQQLSPRAIITGLSLDYDKHCQLEFGAYVQTHEEHDNSMLSRTTGAIALRPTGNAQGGYFFMSLTTGRRLNRYRWTPLPMPQDVIDRVHILARRQNNIRNLIFLDRQGQPNDDDENDNEPRDGDADDATYIPSDTDENDDDDSFGDDTSQTSDPSEGGNDGNNDIANYNANPNNNNDANAENNNDENNENENNDKNENENNANENNDAHDANNENENENDDDLENNSTSDSDSEYSDYPDTESDSDVGLNPLDNNNTEQEMPDLEVQNISDITDDDQYIPINHDDGTHERDDRSVASNNNMNENEMDERYGERQHIHRLRPRRPRDYGHLGADYVFDETVLTQYSMKKGVRKFGNDAIEAVLKELRQLHVRKVIKPVKGDGMSKAERRATLEYLMFLKQKRSGDIKGRGCADGRKQRAWTPKEEASSPTVSIEGVLLSSTIDAKERRDVATVDLPGAFLHSDMDELVHMRFEGTMAELVVKLDPALYKQFVVYEKGKSVLYVELKKALYGTLRAALLFWKTLSNKLKEWKFTINPYDRCVANRIIEGQQCTILWHVDDLKISHVNPKVVTSIIKLLEGEFGVEAPLTINRGKVHEYLGMKIDYSIDGKVMIIMQDYIDEILAEAPDDMKGMAVTPAANHLFVVNSESALKLDEEKAILFHHITAQLLFLCKRARPDIQTAVAFLTTRVKSPDTDDYRKLGRVIKYLRGTRTMPLTLEADDMQVMKWWVDASYAVHPDMKSHTGGALSMGKGVVYGTSTRQKLVTRSSTEAELVGVHDVLPQIMWTKHFLEAQGYTVKEHTIYQDNKSTMLLAQNGRASSGKRTRHIHLRYFYITDRIATGDVEVKYCPTADMVSDYFTKALQGTLFKKLRNLIMNADPESQWYKDHRSVLELECTNGKKSHSQGHKAITSEKKLTKLNGYASTKKQ